MCCDHTSSTNETYAGIQNLYSISTYLLLSEFIHKFISFYFKVVCETNRRDVASNYLITTNAFRLCTFV